MHILVIPSWYMHSYKPLLGIFFKEQAEMLAKHDNKVGLIAVQPIDIRTILEHKKLKFKREKFVENGVSTYKWQYPEIPKLHAIKEFIKLKIFKKMFAEYIKENGLPEIVHLHSFMHGSLAIWLKEEYQIPYVVTEHSSAFGRKLIPSSRYNFVKNTFTKASSLTAVSTKLVELLRENFKLEFTVLANSVNCDFFHHKTRKINQMFKFLNIAFLRRNKNQDMLIKAFAKSFQNNQDVSLIIVGSGPEYENLQHLIQSLGMQEQIELFGEASREEVKELLQESDAFVLSSKYETFGVVVIEAMACGLPVVATKCGGPESIVQDEKVGILVDIDEEQLASAMVKLYENKDFYDANYIASYVEDNFSEKAVYKKLKKVYESVLMEQSKRNHLEH